MSMRWMYRIDILGQDVYKEMCIYYVGTAEYCWSQTLLLIELQLLKSETSRVYTLCLIVISQTLLTYSKLYWALRSSFECYQVFWIPSQPWHCYVTSKYWRHIIHLILPSILVPYLPPYKLVLLLLMFWGTTTWGSPTTELRSGIASISTLIGFFNMPHSI